MPTLRSVQVSLTGAVTGGFNKSFKDANTTLAEFNAKAAALSGSKLGDELNRVEVSARGLKGGLAQLGASGGEVGHVVTAFFTMGPAIGAASAALAIFNARQAAAAEQAKVFSEGQKAYNSLLEKTNEELGKIKKEEGFGQSARSNINEANDAISKLQEANDKINGTGDNILVDAFKHIGQTESERAQAIRDNDTIINQIRDQQRENAKINNQTREARDAQQKYNEAKYDAQVNLHGHDEEKAVEDARLTAEYADQLAAALRKLPAGGTAYLEVQKEYRKVHLEELSYLDQIRKKEVENAKEAQKLADEQKKKQDEIEKGILKQIEESGKAARKRAEEVTEANRTPLEKYKESIEELNSLNLDGTTLGRALAKAKQDYLSTFAKASTNTGFRVVDKSLINVDGLQKGKAIDFAAQQLEQAKKQTELLGDIAGGIENVGAYK